MVLGGRCTGHDILQQTSAVEIAPVVSSAVPHELEDASKYILLVLFYIMFHQVLYRNFVHLKYVLYQWVLGSRVKFKDCFLDSTKEGVWGTEVPVGSRGVAQVWGLGTNPVGSMGNEVPQKLTMFLGLKVYFYEKKRQKCHILTKLDSPFWTPHFAF